MSFRVELNKSFYRLSIAVALLISSAGCLIHRNQHSDYRKIHADAQVGDITAVKQDVSSQPGNINLPDDSGRTPLHLAALRCRLDVTEFLLDKGAKIDSKSTDGATPLHLAAQEGCASVVDLLISKGAPVNARDGKSETPLDRAKRFHQDIIVKTLRKVGGLE